MGSKTKSSIEEMTHYDPKIVMKARAKSCCMYCGSLPVIGSTYAESVLDRMGFHSC